MLIIYNSNRKGVHPSYSISFIISGIFEVLFLDFGGIFTVFFNSLIHLSSTYYFFAACFVLSI